MGVEDEQQRWRTDELRRTLRVCALVLGPEAACDRIADQAGEVVERQLHVRRQAVDMSPFRRVNQALYLISSGAREAAFRNIKTIAECLADEIINAAKGSSNSYAIKKKDEIERVAKANR